ncbi:MAG TPA: GGDEF domain-containing protein [Methylophilaceae bacterium]|nr:GGDEF domain-containing protein [Methylophilaceae bacterium]
MPISSDLLRTATLNKYTLRFTSERLEAFYRQYTLPSLRRQARIALLVGASMYGLYGFLDGVLVPPGAVLKVWYIRTMVVMLAFAVFGVTFYRKFSKSNQILLSLAGLFGGLGLLAKMWLLPEMSIGYYYAGLILTAIWCYSLAGLQFANAVIVNSILFAGFNIMFLWLKPLPLLSLVSYDFFIVAANFIGAFTNYMTGKQHRLLFLREKELDVERRLQHERALHDRLTGLPNRELLMDRVEQALSYAARNEQLCAGFFLDLDKFKPINDTYGHAVGDQVLQEISSRLKKMVRETDTLARLGGDEFFVLARDIKTRTAAEALALKLEQQLEAPLKLKNIDIAESVAVSVGICLFPYKGATAIDIIRRADQAMYLVKRARKNGPPTQTFE